MYIVLWSKKSIIKRIFRRDHQLHFTTVGDDLPEIKESLSFPDIKFVISLNRQNFTCFWVHTWFISFLYIFRWRNRSNCTFHRTIRTVERILFTWNYLTALIELMVKWLNQRKRYHTFILFSFFYSKSLMWSCIILNCAQNFIYMISK